MKKINFEALRNNNLFWIFYISAAFQNALDEYETSLSEFISEEYDTAEAYAWSNEFTQYIDEDTEYIDNPNVIELSLNGNTFSIEFQPFETIYYINGTESGNTGGHYKLRTLSWDGFMNIIGNTDDELVPLLVLPIVALESDNISEAEKIIRASLGRLPFRSGHIQKMTDMIISGLLGQ